MKLAHFRDTDSLKRGSASTSMRSAYQSPALRPAPKKHIAYTHNLNIRPFDPELEAKAAASEYAMTDSLIKGTSTLAHIYYKSRVVDDEMQYRAARTEFSARMSEWLAKDKLTTPLYDEKTQKFGWEDQDKRYDMEARRVSNEIRRKYKLKFKSNASRLDNDIASIKGQHNASIHSYMADRQADRALLNHNANIKGAHTHAAFAEEMQAGWDAGLYASRADWEARVKEGYQGFNVRNTINQTIQSDNTDTLRSILESANPNNPRSFDNYGESGDRVISAVHQRQTERYVNLVTETYGRKKDLNDVDEVLERLALRGYQEEGFFSDAAFRSALASARAQRNYFAGLGSEVARLTKAEIDKRGRLTQATKDVGEAHEANVTGRPYAAKHYGKDGDKKWNEYYEQVASRNTGDGVVYEQPYSDVAIGAVTNAMMANGGVVIPLWSDEIEKRIIAGESESAFAAWKVYKSEHGTNTLTGFGTETRKLFAAMDAKMAKSHSVTPETAYVQYMMEERKPIFMSQRKMDWQDAGYGRTTKGDNGEPAMKDVVEDSIRAWFKTEYNVDMPERYIDQAYEAVKSSFLHGVGDMEEHVVLGMSTYTHFMAPETNIDGEVTFRKNSIYAHHGDKTGTNEAVTDHIRRKLATYEFDRPIPEDAVIRAVWEESATEPTWLIQVNGVVPLAKDGRLPSVGIMQTSGNPIEDFVNKQDSLASAKSALEKVRNDSPPDQEGIDRKVRGYINDAVAFNLDAYAVWADDLVLEVLAGRIAEGGMFIYDEGKDFLTSAKEVVLDALDRVKDTLAPQQIDMDGSVVMGSSYLILNKIIGGLTEHVSRWGEEKAFGDYIEDLPLDKRMSLFNQYVEQHDQLFMKNQAAYGNEGDYADNNRIIIRGAAVMAGKEKFFITDEEYNAWLTGVDPVPEVPSD